MRFWISLIVVGPENDKSDVIMPELTLHTLTMPLKIMAFSRSSSACS